MNSAASLPSICAIRSCSRLTDGSSPYWSSPTGASAMALRMPGEGSVTVSERRSMRSMVSSRAGSGGQAPIGGKSRVGVNHRACCSSSPRTRSFDFAQDEESFPSASPLILSGAAKQRSRRIRRLANMPRRRCEGDQAMSGETTLVRGADWIIAWDEAEQSHVYLEGADLAFRGGEIVFVGKTYDGPAERVIAGGGRMVVPGF